MSATAKAIQGIRFIESLSPEQRSELCDIVNFQHHIESESHKELLVKRLVLGPDEYFS